MSAIGWKADIAVWRTWPYRDDMRSGVQDKIVRLIAEIVALLRPDYGWQADLLIGLKEAVARGDLLEAEKRFASGDIWGGAGSFRDVSFSDSRLNARKCELEIGLVEAFARAGITNRAASETATIYRSWLREGVFKR